MAWTNIDNALVSVGALPFATTIQALRDNPVAIANGDAGAPKVQNAALATINASVLATDAAMINWVLARTAGASVGAVGTYAFLSQNVPGFTNRAPGYTASGLLYSDSNNYAGSTAPGTWRLMGSMNNNSGDPARIASVWVRIA